MEINTIKSNLDEERCKDNLINEKDFYRYKNSCIRFKFKDFNHDQKLTTLAKFILNSSNRNLYGIMLDSNVDDLLKKFEQIRSEWKIIKFKDNELIQCAKFKCICSKDNLRYGFIFKNIKNNTLLLIGSTCVEHFGDADWIDMCESIMYLSNTLLELNNLIDTYIQYNEIINFIINKISEDNTLVKKSRLKFKHYTIYNILSILKTDNKLKISKNFIFTKKFQEKLIQNYWINKSQEETNDILRKINDVISLLVSFNKDGKIELKSNFWRIIATEFKDILNWSPIEKILEQCNSPKYPISKIFDYCKKYKQYIQILAFENDAYNPINNAYIDYLCYDHNFNRSTYDEIINENPRFQYYLKLPKISFGSQFISEINNRYKKLYTENTEFFNDFFKKVIKWFRDKLETEDFYDELTKSALSLNKFKKKGVKKWRAILGYIFSNNQYI